MKVPSTTHTERLGIADVERLCAQGSQIFREVACHDVGIDGFIEVVHEGRATGILIGVQVKSGDSFVRKDGKTFTLPTNPGHLMYWAGCMFPVIGIVHAPATGVTSWIDITSHCTEERIDRGPYTLSWRLGTDNLLTPTTLVAAAIPAALRHLQDPRGRQRLQDTLNVCRDRWKARFPALLEDAGSDERINAWRELVAFLLSPGSSIAEVADTAYRLSWYLPPTEDVRIEILDELLGTASEHHIRRLLQAVGHAEDVGGGEYADHVASIVARIPGVVDRIEKLLSRALLPRDTVLVAIRVIEFIEQEPRNDLRAAYQGTA